MLRAGEGLPQGQAHQIVIQFQITEIELFLKTYI